MNAASDASDLVVAAALRLEARALRRGAPGLHVLRTGMGPARSRLAAGRLEADGARAMAIAGLCGALDASLPVGEVIVASELRGDGDLVHPCEVESLCEELRARGIGPLVGPLHSADHVVRGGARQALRRTGALAVDMESAWLARASRQRPLAVVRVVLDAPGREIARPGIAFDSFRALRRLAATAPALAAWAARIPEPRTAATAELG